MYKMVSPLTNVQHVEVIEPDVSPRTAAKDKESTGHHRAAVVTARFGLLPAHVGKLPDQ